MADVFPQPGANPRNYWLSNIPKPTGGFGTSPKTLMLSAHPPTVLGTCLGEGPGSWSRHKDGADTRMEEGQGWRSSFPSGAATNYQSLGVTPVYSCLPRKCHRGFDVLQQEIFTIRLLLEVLGCLSRGLVIADSARSSLGGEFHLWLQGWISSP